MRPSHNYVNQTILKATPEWRRVLIKDGCSRFCRLTSPLLLIPRLRREPSTPVFAPAEGDSATWLTLDQPTTIPRLFSPYLVAALRKAAPEAGATTLTPGVAPTTNRTLTVDGRTRLKVGPAAGRSFAWYSRWDGGGTTHT